jgi:hypothetical protein
MSIETKVADLFSEAIREGRNDIVAAVSPFVEISGLVECLSADKSIFSGTFKNGFLRKSYVGEDLRAMSRDFLFKDVPGYHRFYEALGAESDMDDASRTMLINNYLSHGRYHCAKDAIVKLSDPAAYFTQLKERLKSMRHIGAEGTFALVGQPSGWTNDAISILVRAGIEIPDDHENYARTSQNYPWQRARMASQVNAVGDYQSANGLLTPKVSGDRSTLSFSRGNELAEVFLLEYLRLNCENRRGGWNARNFPKYLPVLVDRNDHERLKVLGAIAISPKSHAIKSDGTSIIHHGFVSTSNQLSEADVAMSMTLLSREEVALHIKNEEECLMLIPAEALPEQALTLDDKFPVVMRGHRPEIIQILLNGTDKQYSLFDRECGTQLYLRGCYLEKSHLNATVELASDVLRDNMHKYFSTDAERQWLGDKVFKIGFNQGDEPIDVAISRFDAEYKMATDYYGAKPSIDISGSLDFLEALSWRMGGYTISGAYEVTDKGLDRPLRDTLCGQYGISKHHRLSARLGACPEKLANEFGRTPEELLTKGVRIKDDTAKEKIKGMLDRIDLVELAAIAKTDKQVEFLRDNFDFSSVYEKLPAKFRQKVGRASLSNAFDL